MASNAVEKLRAQVRSARERKTEIVENFEEQAMGAVGGIGCALVKKYLPKLIPGTQFDETATWAGTMFFDLMAGVSGSHLANGAACGANGYLAGTTLDRILA